MKGIVVKSTGSWYHLRTEDGSTYQARIRGKFRIANIKHTNPIAVGDEVDFEIDKDEMLENIKKGKWLLRVPDEL